MPASVDLNLLRTFQKERDVEWFLHQHFPVACDVPKAREPEFGILMNRMETSHAIQEHILSNPYIREIGDPIPHDGFLVSLPQDTVDEEGFPTRLMDQFGIESRRRFNYKADTRKTSRYDVSFKSKGKGDDRKEWEADSTGFNNGMREAMQKVAEDHPEIHGVNPDNYCVTGVCLAARSSTNILQIFPDLSACIKWEINDDPCAIATPHADILLGYRREKEPEIKELYFPAETIISPSMINHTITRGLDELKGTISSGSYGEEICFATESKGAYTTRLVGEYYDEHSVGYDNASNGHVWNGEEIALIQNVIANTFLGKTTKLQLLAQTIPSSAAVSNATPQTSYDGFFPTRTDSPKNQNGFSIIKMA